MGEPQLSLFFKELYKLTTLFVTLSVTAATTWREQNLLVERLLERATCSETSGATGNRQTSGIVDCSQRPQDTDNVRNLISSNQAPSDTPVRLFGFRMWKEHMSDASTDMTAPALSNSPQ